MTLFFIMCQPFKWVHPRESKLIGGGLIRWRSSSPTPYSDQAEARRRRVGRDGEEAAQQGQDVHHEDGVGDGVGRRQVQGDPDPLQAPPFLLLRVKPHL